MKHTRRFWLWHFCSIMWKYDIIHITGITSEEDQATANSNTYRKFSEIWTCHFWDMRTNRQTDRQTYRHTDHNTSSTYRWRSKTRKPTSMRGQKGIEAVYLVPKNLSYVILIVIAYSLKTVRLVHRGVVEFNDASRRSRSVLFRRCVNMPRHGQTS